MTAPAHGVLHTAQQAAASTPISARARQGSPQRMHMHALASTSGRTGATLPGQLEHCRRFSRQTSASGSRCTPISAGNSNSLAQADTRAPAASDIQRVRQSQRQSNPAKRQKRPKLADEERGLLLDMFPDFNTWSHTLPTKGRGGSHSRPGPPFESQQGNSLIPDVLPADPEHAAAARRNARRKHSKAGVIAGSSSTSQQGGRSVALAAGGQSAPRQGQGSVVLDDIDMLINAVR